MPENDPLYLQLHFVVRFAWLCNWLCLHSCTVRVCACLWVLC